VTVSSAEERDFYPTPEFKNLLTTAKRLRREVSRLGVRMADNVSYNRLLKNLDALEGSLNVHFKELYALERALMAASTRLTKKQRMLLRWLAEDYEGGEVYTALIERISEELSIPKSTVRWNLRGIREAGFIRAGDKENKGIPVRLTERGRIMAESVVMDAF
jgi:DNA-binding MarR family transcriptional regulator